MIIIFHSLYFLIKHFAKVYRTAKALSSFRSSPLIGEEVRIHTNCIVTDSLDLRFDPPLYKQRYATVQQILLNVTWKSRIRKVVDFGCGDYNFFPYLKHLYDINEIVFVDVDEDILNYSLFKLRPLTVDYLKQRPDRLKVQVLLGSISQPDVRVAGCDAIVAIELIEHLYPDTLEALPYNVFHYIKPLLAVFTTPNYEFNVLFPDTKVFRHADHKFEWNREQFESWALNITTRFPNYTVQFDGIGPGPKGSESVGCCTQVAIFLRHTEESEQLAEVPKACRELKAKIKNLNVEDHNESHGICTYYSYVGQIQEFSGVTNDEGDLNYREIECINYPFHIDTRTPEERMLHEVQYKIYSASASSRFYNEEKHRIEYPLYELVSNEGGCFATVPELRTLLEKENFQIECLPHGCDKQTLCVIYNPRMEDHSSSPSSDGNSSDDKGTYKIPWNLSADESDWETEYSQTVKISEEMTEKEGKVEDTNQESQNNNNSNNNDGNNNLNEQRKTYQFHGTVANTSAVEEKTNAKQDLSNLKQQTNSHLKLPGTSNEHNSDKTPKKGTKNIKNKDVRTFNQGTSKDTDSKKRKADNNLSSNVDVNDKKSYKKNIELKVHDSVHSQGSNVHKNSNRNTKSSISAGVKSNSKGKIMTTSSLKRFPAKTDDSSLPSTSDVKKKKKGSRKTEEDNKDDMKALTECIVYNTLNSVAEVVKTGEEIRIKNLECIIENLALAEESNEAVGRDIIDQVLANMQFTAASSQSASNSGETDTKKTKEPTGSVEPANQELNHASREALFDPNSEIDMLEEFEIPAPPPLPAHLHAPANEHHNVILIGLNPINDEESVVLPDNADPFPNWLLQLLGANVEEGESHDEPHFYCQGDGIGVHPSVIEVEIDEEESSSDSSSSHHEAEAGYTSSDSGVVQLPPDETDESNAQEDNAFVVPSLDPSRFVTGNNSAAESADEFFDSLEETLTINNRPNSEINRRN